MRPLLLTLAAAALLAGCGPGTKPVAGKVTYQGKPVVWGSVTLKAADGTVHQAGLNPDGSYKIAKVPVGTAKVGVASPKPEPPPRAAAEADSRTPPPPPPPPPAGAWFPLPANLADPNTSGVTIQVGGPGDIELK